MLTVPSTFTLVYTHFKPFFGCQACQYGSLQQEAAGGDNLMEWNTSGYDQHPEEVFTMVASLSFRVNLYPFAWGGSRFSDSHPTQDGWFPTTPRMADIF